MLPIKIAMAEYTVRSVGGGWKPVLELLYEGQVLESASPEGIGTYLGKKHIAESRTSYIGLSAKIKNRVRKARNGL